MSQEENKKKNITLDDLAVEMRRGFNELRTDMERGFNEVRADIAAHDQKFDELSETVNKLPPSEEVQAMIDHTYSLAVLRTEHDRRKEIIRKKLDVEV